MSGILLRAVIASGFLFAACAVSASVRCDSVRLDAVVALVDSLPRTEAPEMLSVTADSLPGDVSVAAVTADSVQSAAPVRRKSIIRRVIDYFGQSTQDRTFEKKIDFTFAGGPSYSKNTSLGIGLLAAGLYRLDRTDSVTAPSDISLYANVSISGFYAVGISGNTIFAHNRQRVDYTLEFSSAPTDTWGIGYDDVQRDEKRSYTEQRYKVQARYLREVLPHTYIGGLLSFEHAKASKYDASTPLFEGQRSHYTDAGVGLTVEYDSRDFIPNPFRGVYLSLQGVVYPAWMGSCDKTLHRLTFTADYYRRVWKDAILAFDLYGEFNAMGTPWTMMARMGGNQRMRGYYKGQYMDNNLLTAQMELRQRVWRRIGCVAWVGAGNVFPSPQEFDWSETLPNYGLGVRWELKKRVNVRLDYGFGKKTSGFLLSINEAF